MVLTTCHCKIGRFECGARGENYNKRNCACKNIPANSLGSGRHKCNAYEQVYEVIAKEEEAKQKQLRQNGIKALYKARQNEREEVKQKQSQAAIDAIGLSALSEMYQSLSIKDSQDMIDTLRNHISEVKKTHPCELCGVVFNCGKTTCRACFTEPQSGFEHLVSLHPPPERKLHLCESCDNDIVNPTWEDIYDGRSNHSSPAKASPIKKFREIAWVEFILFHYNDMKENDREDKQLLDLAEKVVSLYPLAYPKLPDISEQLMKRVVSTDWKAHIRNEYLDSLYAIEENDPDEGFVVEEDFIKVRMLAYLFPEHPPPEFKEDSESDPPFEPDLPEDLHEPVSTLTSTPPPYEAHQKYPNAGSSDDEDPLAHVRKTPAKSRYD